MLLRKRLLFISLLVGLSSIANAQVLDTVSRLSFSGYVDAYYAHYSDELGAGKIQKFPTVSPRSDNMGLNVALLDCKYESKNIRAHVAFHYGDIPLSAWSPTYNYIARAHVGIRLAKNLWLDAGFFRTHFGTELLYPVENIASSVSIGTFYEPYYESGFRLEYTPTDKFSLDVYGLNGYGIYEDNNWKKSVGVLAAYTFSDKFNLNYSNYIGDDAPSSSDTVSHLRIHQNVYFNITLHKLLIQAGGDFCMQQHAKINDPSKMGTMFSALATIKYQFVDKFALYARYEVFNDANGYMSTLFLDNAGHMTGYKLWGITAGAEFKPFENSYIRVEGRDIQMDQDQQIFKTDGKPTNVRMEVMATMGVSFDILKRVRTK